MFRGDNDRIKLRLPDGLALDYEQAAFARDVREQLLKRERVVLGIRPYAVRRARDGVPATVSANQWLGDQTHIAADFAGGSLVLVEHDRTRLERGETIGIRIDPAEPARLRRRQRRGDLARRGACVMRDLLIGIDAGTSVIKSVAFDLGGRQIAFAALPNRYETIPGGGAEQDLARTWADAATTLQATRRRGAGPCPPHRGDRRHRAGRRHLADRQGRRAGRPKAGSGSTPAAASLVEEIRARSDDRVRFEKTGTGLAACQQGSQLAWIKRNRPEMLSNAATAFHCKDWLYFKLTGERATDPSEGTFTFGDFRTRNYSDDVIELLGLNDLRHLLPPVVDGTRQTAGLSQQAAGVTGLLAGTPVVLGYVDVDLHRARRRPLRPPSARRAAPSSARPACTCASPRRPTT